VSLGPHEIQVGILKRLRGTPIVRHDAEWHMAYNPVPPYEILQNKLINFETMQKMRRFAKYWDLVGNSGNFVDTTPLIWNDPKGRASVAGRDSVESQSSSLQKDIGARETLAPPSPFYAFLRWSDWLHARVGRTDSIALVRLMELLFEFLTTELKLDPQKVAATMWRDYQRGGRSDKPSFVKDWLAPAKPAMLDRKRKSELPPRQARHLT
jgi:hypothetical protein